MSKEISLDSSTNNIVTSCSKSHQLGIFQRLMEVLCSPIYSFFILTLKKKSEKNIKNETEMSVCDALTFSDLKRRDQSKSQNRLQIKGTKQYSVFDHKSIRKKKKHETEIPKATRTDISRCMTIKGEKNCVMFQCLCFLASPGREHDHRLFNPRVSVFMLCV